MFLETLHTSLIVIKQIFQIQPSKLLLFTEGCFRYKYLMKLLSNCNSHVNEIQNVSFSMAH